MRNKETKNRKRIAVKSTSRSSVSLFLVFASFREGALFFFLLSFPLEPMHFVPGSLHSTTPSLLQPPHLSPSLLPPTLFVPFRRRSCPKKTKHFQNSTKVSFLKTLPIFPVLVPSLSPSFISLSLSYLLQYSRRLSLSLTLTLSISISLSGSCPTTTRRQKASMVPLTSVYVHEEKRRRRRGKKNLFTGAKASGRERERERERERSSKAARASARYWNFKRSLSSSPSNIKQPFSKPEQKRKPLKPKL